MSNRSAGRLPTHELTARRNRKRTLTKLPALIPCRAPAPAPKLTPGVRTNVPGQLLTPYSHPQTKIN